MQKFMLILSVCFFNQATFAQTVSISSTSPLVLYQWMENPVTIVLENTACSNIVVKTSGGKISGTGCNYIFTTTDTGVHAAEIVIGVKQGPKVKWVKVVSCRVKPFPTPPVRLAWRTTGPVPKVLLLSMPGLEIPDYSFGLEATEASPRIQKIIQFSVQLLRNGNVIYTRNGVQGNILPEDLTNFIKNEVRENDEIVVNDVTMLLYEKEYRKYEGEIRLRIN